MAFLSKNKLNVLRRGLSKSNSDKETTNSKGHEDIEQSEQQNELDSSSDKDAALTKKASIVAALIESKHVKEFLDIFNEEDVDIWKQNLSKGAIAVRTGPLKASEGDSGMIVPGPNSLLHDFGKHIPTFIEIVTLKERGVGFDKNQYVSKANRLNNDLRALFAKLTRKSVSYSKGLNFDILSALMALFLFDDKTFKDVQVILNETKESAEKEWEEQVSSISGAHARKWTYEDQYLVLVNNFDQKKTTRQLLPNGVTKDFIARLNHASLDEAIKDKLLAQIIAMNPF